MSETPPPPPGMPPIPPPPPPPGFGLDEKEDEDNLSLEGEEDNASDIEDISKLVDEMPSPEIAETPPPLPPELAAPPPFPAEGAAVVDVDERKSLRHNLRDCACS